MVAAQSKVVLDTNIIISALGFGGKPREIIRLVQDNKIQAVSSPVLIAELTDIISKKFPKLKPHLKRILKQLEEIITLVNPGVSIHVLNDEDDNRVLEAAVEGKCQYIITGDKELLKLGMFKGIRIVTANEFL